LIFYLPLALKCYGETFKKAEKKKRAPRDHTPYSWLGHYILNPCVDKKNWLSLENFIDIRDRFDKNKMTIVDRYRGDSAIVQIIDHRNFSGTNPLIGKTPIGNRPQFPDVSKLYNRKELGLKQVVVDCLGKERFQREKKRKGVSEVVAHIALAAHYVGWKITAFGWCQELDEKGSKLSKVLQDTF